MYHPHPTPDYTAATPTPSQQGGHQPPYQSPLGAGGAATDPAPVLPGGQGGDFTDAWVSQAANVTATEDWEDMRPDSGMSGGRYSDEEDQEEEEDGEYLDQETVEQFEDRVLNKRAGKVGQQAIHTYSIYSPTFNSLFPPLAPLPNEEAFRRFHNLDILRFERKERQEERLGSEVLLTPCSSKGKGGLVSPKLCSLIFF